VLAQAAAGTLEQGFQQVAVGEDGRHIHNAEIQRLFLVIPDRANFFGFNKS